MKKFTSTLFLTLLFLSSTTFANDITDMFSCYDQNDQTHKFSIVHVDYSEEVQIGILYDINNEKHLLTLFKEKGDHVVRNEYVFVIADGKNPRNAMALTM